MVKFVRAFIAAATLITTSVSAAFAGEKVKIVNAIYGGSGCPENSAAVQISPDGQELTILFDKFIAIANNQIQSRKSCNVSIAIKLPQGFQISLYDTDYRGYVSPATTGTLRSEYTFAGERGPIFTRNLVGGSNYFVRDNLVNITNIWSACGDSVNMQVNASMVARGVGIATLDYFDLVNRGLVYHIKYRRCI
ncbi:DUF4360 domain-containing protein [Nostoc sp. CHAB 5836]|uniref:DUF4360 domain-containing protein n=1 Tax=Nostoc sp. CHAB 5836 TaxID=2780404 RepID=UPI001E3C607A|nr:DUF4360 domain-containing protein [Nostoc sp. CHAB 5836]MCC5617887.1 DUF4360 domain-containing protein [Nostoc sp. CHAB 5836]